MKTIIVNDNGGGNIDKERTFLREAGIRQYRTAPRRPKEKAFIERFTGTLRRESLDYHYKPINAGKPAEVVDACLDKYRPHESLGFLTQA